MDGCIASLGKLTLSLYHQYVIVPSVCHCTISRSLYHQYAIVPSLCHCTISMSLYHQYVICVKCIVERKTPGLFPRAKESFTLNKKQDQGSEEFIIRRPMIKSSNSILS